MLSNTLNQIGTDHVYKMQKSSPTREHTNLLSIIKDTHIYVYSSIAMKVCCFTQP